VFTARYGLDILCIIRVNFSFKVFTEHMLLGFFKFDILVPRITGNQNSLQLPSLESSLRSFVLLTHPMFSSEKRERVVGRKWRSHLAV